MLAVADSTFWLGGDNAIGPNNNWPIYTMVQKKRRFIHRTVVSTNVDRSAHGVLS